MLEEKSQLFEMSNLKLLLFVSILFYQIDYVQVVDHLLKCIKEEQHDTFFNKSQAASCTCRLNHLPGLCTSATVSSTFNENAAMEREIEELTGIITFAFVTLTATKLFIVLYVLMDQIGMFDVGNPLQAENNYFCLVCITLSWAYVALLLAVTFLPDFVKGIVQDPESNEEIQLLVDEEELRKRFINELQGIFVQTYCSGHICFSSESVT